MAARSHRKSTPAKHRHHRAAPHLVPKHKSSKPSILVADDDIDARTMYGMFLKSRGCEVYTASDGAGAIRQAMAVHPDLIVLDTTKVKHQEDGTSGRRPRRAGA